MTCIAAVAQDGEVVMGGDSAAVEERSYLLGICQETKVWRAGELLFGSCGSFRVSQLIRWSMTLPTPEADDDALVYLVGPLADSMRNVLETGGALTTWQDTGVEELTSSGLLIGFRGRVFEMYPDFGVGELVEGYGSVGCGAPLALGSLATTHRLDLSPKRRVRMALEASERHNAGVRRPFHIERLRG